MSQQDAEMSPPQASLSNKSFSSGTSSTLTSFQDADVKRNTDASTAPECTGPARPSNRTRKPSHISIPMGSVRNSVLATPGGLQAALTPASSSCSVSMTPFFPVEMCQIRYSGYNNVRSTVNKYTEVAPLTISFERINCPDWDTHIHPDGQPYFARTFSFESGEFCFMTDSDVRNPDILASFDDFRHEFAHLARDIVKNQRVPWQVVCIEDQDEPESSTLWKYYILEQDFANRTVFWLHPFNIEGYLNEVKGIEDAGHLKNYMEYQFWLHHELYPHSQVSPEILTEASHILIHSEIDLATSEFSNSAFTTGQLNAIRDLLTEARGSNGSPYITAPIARIMTFIANERYLNFHGQFGARLSCNQSLCATPQEREKQTMFIRLLSPVLFFAPDVHLRGLRKIWVDDKIMEKQWKQFVETLKDEWNEFILYATVLLAANVSFLAIPSVDAPHEASWGQILSILSIAASIGSIILGLLLVRQHRTKSKDNAADAALHLVNSTVPYFGLEPLTVMYSLPYALLIWAMVTFLGATLVISFNSTTKLQKSIISLSWGAVLFLIGTTIFANWQKNTAPFSAVILFCLRKFEKKAKEGVQEIIGHTYNGGSDTSEQNSHLTSNAGFGSISGDEKPPRKRILQVGSRLKSRFASARNMSLMERWKSE